MKRLLSTVVLVCTWAGTSLAQEREWILDAAAEDAFLVFGVPQTEDVGLSFWCKIGSGKINLLTPEPGIKLKDAMPTTIAVTVAGKTYNVQGRTAIGSDSMRGSVEAEIRPDDPLFDALKSTDRFSIQASGHKTVYPTEGADFAGLLKVCLTG